MRIGGSVKALMGSKKKAKSADVQKPAPWATFAAPWATFAAPSASSGSARSSAGSDGDAVREQECATRVPVLGELVVFTCLQKAAQQREVNRTYLSSVRNKLGMGAQAERKAAESGTIFLPLDNILKEYHNYCADFGPLSIACVARLAALMDEALEHQKEDSKQIVLCSSDDDESRTNAACLIACWLILERGYSAKEAWAPFHAADKATPFLHFKEASYLHESAQFPLYVTDVLEGVYKAKENGLLSLAGFDVDRYTLLDNPRVANLNTIVPGLFVAFAGPKDTHYMRDPLNACEHTPEEFLDLFREEGVSDIVRLNDKLYDAGVFRSAGFNHTDITFDDCSNPTATVLKSWFELCAARTGAVAVHCKAGLGRTGVLIAAWLMRKHKFSGREVIGFLRLMRPGSILGPQQDFLVDNEALFWSMGDPDLYDETVMYKDCAPVPRSKPAAAAKPLPEVMFSDTVDFAAPPAACWEALSDGNSRQCLISDASETALSEQDTVNTSSGSSLLPDDLQSVDEADDMRLANCSGESDGWGGAVEEALRQLRARENTEAMYRRAKKIAEEQDLRRDGPATMSKKRSPPSHTRRLKIWGT